MDGAWDEAFRQTNNRAMITDPIRKTAQISVVQSCVSVDGAAFIEVPYLRLERNVEAQLLTKGEQPRKPREQAHMRKIQTEARQQEHWKQSDR